MTYGQGGHAKPFVSALRYTGLFATTALILCCLTVGQGQAAASAQGRTGVHPAKGLGKVLTTKDGGQIFGFDIDQNGDNGVLATSQDTASGSLVSVETFDQNTGKIVKLFAKYDGPRNGYAVHGIFAGDVGLITHYIHTTPKYEVMNPVTADGFTGAWTPPIRDLDVVMTSTDQSTATSVLYAVDLQHTSNPLLLVSDIAANTFAKVVHLDFDRFSLYSEPQLAQYTAANQAYIALSPDQGRAGGAAPLNALINLDTGRVITSNGYNNGFYHAGYVNGAAVDPHSGVAATTTELNSQVEFYDLNKKLGIAFSPLPCTHGSDLGSGSGVAVDSVNKLFLVTETFDACNAGEDSAIHVYDEAGNFVETIPGFKFVAGEPAPVLNPSKRMGWAFGGPNGASQLQQFFY